MIDIKKYELSTTGICAPVVVATWGGIKGDIENQQDLVDYVASHGGGGNAMWGSITGDISDQTDLTALLSEYATQEWVNDQGFLTDSDLSGYATESWVGQQGYITSSALSGYATEAWVGQQGFLTEHQSIKTINYQSLVGEGDLALTDIAPEEMAAIDPLLKPDDGYLKSVIIKNHSSIDLTYPIIDSVYYFHLFNTGSEILAVNSGETVYKYNPEKLEFNELFTLSITNSAPMWRDGTGRLYVGCDTVVTKETDGTCAAIDLGISSTYAYSLNRHNILKGHNGIYHIVDSTTHYKFDENLQSFVQYDIRVPENWDWSSITMNFFEYNGHIICYTDASTCWELFEYDNYVSIEYVNSYFNNAVIKSYFRSSGFVPCGSGMYFFSGNRHYYLNSNLGWSTNYIYNENNTRINMTSSGVVYGDYMIGYTRPSTGKFTIINPSRDNYITKTFWGDLDLTGYATQSWVDGQGYVVSKDLEDYATMEWVGQQGYASDSDLTALASRVTALETNYGDAITITNNILG